MPFDIENSVKWDSNYLKGYSSEKRDTNVDDLRPLVDKQAKDVARYAANDTLQHYDRGVRWNSENLSVKGTQWKSAYLPVWLYSYRQEKGNSSILHYVAVNARTKETMGSVPIHMPKLVIVSLLIELLCFIGMMLWDSDYNWLLLLVGFIYFFVMHSRYRNSGARHHHEVETKKTMSNLRQVDNFVKHRNHIRNSSMDGANNRRIEG